MALRSRISLTSIQRGELQAHLRRRNLPASVAVRIRIVLLLEEGASYSEIKEKLDITAPIISLWKKRYLAQGVVGLATFIRGSYLADPRTLRQTPNLKK
jgi:hypothetical protein